MCALRPLARAARRRAARAALIALLGGALALLAWLADVRGSAWSTPAALRLLALPLVGAALAALAAGSGCEARARRSARPTPRPRLAELQSRIRPHFLFNALNTALALVRVDPARAEGVLEDLAELFRVALADDNGGSVSLAEEIELARRYLAIEQIRFGERLRWSWDLDPAAGAARVPPLVLQPLVENAVRHGVEPSDGRRHDPRAHAGAPRPGRDHASTTPCRRRRRSPATGWRWRNVRERLRLLHDVAAQFDAKRDGSRFRVQIVVPL